MSLFALTGHLSTCLKAPCTSKGALRLSVLLALFVAVGQLAPAEIGQAALALAVSELLRALAASEAPARVLTARAEALEEVCIGIRRELRLRCRGLAGLQLGMAGLLWGTTGQGTVPLLLALLSAELLFVPGDRLRQALLERRGDGANCRANRRRSALLSNLLTVLALLAWPSALALILPRLLPIPLRAVLPCARRAGALASEGFVSCASAHVTQPVLALARVLRLEVDKIAVGIFLGMEMLGVYVIALHLGRAMMRLMQNLSSHAPLKNGLRSGMVRLFGITLPGTVLLSLLVTHFLSWSALEWLVAPSPAIFLVFGLAALPTALWEVACEGLPQARQIPLEFAMSLGMAGALFANIALLSPYGLGAIVQGYLITALLAQGGASLVALLPVLARTRSSLQSEAF